MSTCRLLLLGPPQVIKNDQVAHINLRKAIALVAFLAVEQRPFSREYLATLLWPDLGQKGALANLRRTLSLLRATFENGCMVADGDHLELNRGLVDLDVDDFRQLTSSDVSDADLDRLESASLLYRGSFMEGFTLGDCLEFDEWQDSVRHRLRMECDAMLERLCRGYLQTAMPERALPHGQQWLALDNLNEAAHRTLMEIYARTGRKNAAHRQYESCTQVLAREGLEPDDLTHELHDAIAGNQIGPEAPEHSDSDPDENEEPRQDRKDAANEPLIQPQEPDSQHRRRGRRRAIVAVIAVALAVGLITTGIKVAPLLIGFDVGVTALEVRQIGNMLSTVRFAVTNKGITQSKVAYSVFFLSDQSVVAAREYVVYSGETPIRMNTEATVEVDRQSDIQRFVEENNVRIPPGNYSAGVRITDFKGRHQSEFNDNVSNSALFFFSGTAADDAFEVEIAYAERAPLDDANPLLVFIGDISRRGDKTQRRGSGGWGQFRVTSEGRYFFPVYDVKEPDDDGSGYFMVIVHDIGGNLEDPFYTRPGDVAAFYKEGEDNLAFGLFNVSHATPIQPGGRYSINFSVPLLPDPDEFEADDSPEIATLIDYADLPVRQYHTFHDKGTGDIDYDWFRIFLKTGESLVVETYSAGGRWEVDTSIDFNDSSEYIESGADKSFEDNYSKLTYVNNTGIDQTFYLLVKPFNQFNISTFVIGEYIVEFRK